MSWSLNKRIMKMKCFANIYIFFYLLTQPTNEPKWLFLLWTENRGKHIKYSNRFSSPDPKNSSELLSLFGVCLVWTIQNSETTSKKLIDDRGKTHTDTIKPLFSKKWKIVHILQAFLKQCNLLKIWKILLILTKINLKISTETTDLI